MNTADRELLQQVLRELEGIPFYRKYGVRIRNAITALQKRLAHCDRCGKKLGGEGDIHTCTPDPIGDARDRLIAELAAQPEQEPVAIDWDTKTDTPIMGYTTPPAAQRTWVGLTDAEIQAIHDTYYRRMGPQEFARAIEAKLKEKNT